MVCLGDLNGSEQKWFIKNLPDAAVIGTEISHTAAEFPNTIQHDFHVPIEEYINKFDILLSHFHFFNRYCDSAKQNPKTN